MSDSFKSSQNKTKQRETQLLVDLQLWPDPIRTENYVNILSIVDKDQLEPNASLLLHNKTMSVVGLLTDEVDPLVQVMKVRSSPPARISSPKKATSRSSIPKAVSVQRIPCYFRAGKNLKATGSDTMRCVVATPHCRVHNPQANVRLHSSAWTIDAMPKTISSVSIGREAWNRFYTKSRK